MHGGLICIAFCLWLDQKYFTKIHISKSIAPRAMELGQGMDVDDPKFDPEGQGHRSNVKVTGSKNVIWGLIQNSYLEKYCP